MRIINKHYAQLLLGYDRMMDISQKSNRLWKRGGRIYEPFHLMFRM
jgi:hypothetical protein